MIHGFAVIDAGQQTLPDHVIQSFESQIRVDGRSAVADQEAIVMNFSRITGFDDQGRFCPHSFADQVMMQT